MDTQSIRQPSLPGDLSSSDTSHTKEIVRVRGGESYGRATAIDMLSDDALLNIFHFYRENNNPYVHAIWTWHVLVHVCQRWRRLIFESPVGLKVQILCKNKAPVPNQSKKGSKKKKKKEKEKPSVPRSLLGVWPASFPITIHYDYTLEWSPSGDDEERNVDQDVKAVLLGHRDRVSRINLYVTGPKLANLVTVMLEPFPTLTDLQIFSADEDQALPDEFLGGSAPYLQELKVYNTPYPALPTLLLSTKNLITLRLTMPPRGYISPETMVAYLEALPKLETLDIKFKSASFRPDQIRPPPVTRIVLPSLTSFGFESASEYLEDLVAQIDAPRLIQIRIFHLNPVAGIPVAQLPEFVDRSMGPKLILYNHAEIRLYNDFISLTMSYFHPEMPPTSLIAFKVVGGKASRIVELLDHFSTTKILSNVVHLKLDADPDIEGIDGVKWFHILRQFSAVQSLQVTLELAGYVALTLKSFTGEMAGEVLPSLNLIHLAKQSASSVKKFIAGRALSDRPVTVVDTIPEFRKRLESSVSKYQLDTLYEEPEIWSDQGSIVGE